MKFDAHNASFIYQLRKFLLSLLHMRIRFILWSLLLVIGTLILILESYYQYCSCAVSQEYSNRNIKLTHKAIDMLDSLSIPHWPDFQSLLNVLRNETYNIWDADVDLSIEWPLRSNLSDPKLKNIDIFIKHIEKCGFRVDFLPDRKLIQLKFQDDTSKDLSHVDIWLWTRKYIYNHNGNNYEKEIVLEHNDYTIKYKSRFISEIYPLKPAKWLGRNVTIPFDSDTISYKEYGASYMKPTVFRKNCLHNLINGRWI